MAAYPTFPELTRKSALKTKTTTVDPTLRDTMDNGMETTRARFTRRRRQLTVTIDLLTNDDKAKLELFVQLTAVYGANAFYFTDDRDATNVTQILVRFSKLPEYTDVGWVLDQFRQSCTFELREV